MKILLRVNLVLNCDILCHSLKPSYVIPAPVRYTQIKHRPSKGTAKQLRLLASRTPLGITVEWRFSQEFSMTLRPELRDLADFVEVDNPEVAPAPTIAEALWGAVRLNPGQTQSNLLVNLGLSKRKVLSALEEFHGKLWRSERGDFNARRFYPADWSDPGETSL
jgi:hypothetical protein